VSDSRIEEKIGDVLEAVTRRRYRGPALSVQQRSIPPAQEPAPDPETPGFTPDRAAPQVRPLRVIRHPATIEEVVAQLLSPYEIETGMLRRQSFYLAEEDIRLLRMMAERVGRDQSEVLRSAVRALFIASEQIFASGLADSLPDNVEVANLDPSGMVDAARRLLLPPVRVSYRTLTRRTFYLSPDETSMLRRMSGWFGRDYSALVRAAVRGLAAELAAPQHGREGVPDRTA